MPEFERALLMTRRQMQAMGLGNVDTGALEGQLLRQMVMQRLTDFNMQDIGLSVGDPLLAAQLRKAPALQNASGHFDRTRFQMLLQQQGMSEEGFLARLRGDIAAQTMESSLDVSDMPLPASLASLQALAAGETRDAVLITVPASSVTAKAPDDKALKDYYDRQKDQLYVEPERRTLEYATIPAPALTALVDKHITDTMLQDRFTQEGGKGDLAAAKPKLTAELRDETRDATLQELSNQVEDALAAGKSLGEALKAAGLTVTMKTLPNVAQADAQGKDATASAVILKGFGLGEGEASGLAMAKDGTYFVVADKSIAPSAPKPFDAVKADVARRLSDEARQSAVMDKANAFIAEYKKSGDLKTPGAFTTQRVSGIARLGKPPAGLPAPLAEAVFEHASGEVAGPLALPNGNAVLAVVTGIHHDAKAQASPEARKRYLQALNGEVVEAYYQALAQRYPVDVNQQLLQSAHKDTADE
ncbi:MAG: peptidylprolyl isomerase [Alphaproteobacteria bacterium]